MAEGFRELGAEEDICNYLRGREVAASWRKLDNVEAYDQMLFG
jgi:hypothetical protein